jgi:RHS repeat-associated protein
MLSSARKLLFVSVVLSLMLSAVLPSGATPTKASSDLLVPQVPDPYALVRALSGDPQSNLIAAALSGMPDVPDRLPQWTASPGSAGPDLPMPDRPALPTIFPAGPETSIPGAPQPAHAPQLPAQSTQTPAASSLNEGRTAPVSPRPDWLRFAPKLNLPGSLLGALAAPSWEPALPVKQPARVTSEVASPARSAAAYQVYLPWIARDATPGLETVTVQPNQQQVTRFDGGQVTLVIPAGALTQTTTIAYQRRDGDWIPGRPQVLTSFELTAQAGGTRLTSFAAPLALTVRYADAAVPEKGQLRLVSYNPTHQSWIGLPIQMDVEQNTVTASIDQFSLFALSVMTGTCETAGVGVGAAVPISVTQLFIDACERNGGIAAIGTPLGQVHHWADQYNWTQDFNWASLIHNEMRNKVFYVQGPIISTLVDDVPNGPGGWIGAPKSDPMPSPPPHFKDFDSDFTGQRMNYFEHGFIGFNQATHDWEASKYYPQVLEVNVDAVPMASGIVTRSQLFFSAQIDVAPQYPASFPTEVILGIEDDDNAQSWQGNMIPGGGFQEWLKAYPNLVDEGGRIQFMIDAHRMPDNRSGYAPCDWVVLQQMYTLTVTAGSSYHYAFRCVDPGTIGGGGGDATPPVIQFIEVWPDGQGNLSVVAEITDDSGLVAAYSITGGPGDLTYPLTYRPDLGPNLYGAIFSRIPNNEVVGFTVTAYDASFNTATASGSSRSPIKGRFGLSCTNPCNPYDFAIANPILMSTLNKVEPLPILSLIGPGDSDINIELTYNGQNSGISLAGQGWTFPYQMSLEFHKNPLLIGAQVTYPDGRMVTFADSGNGTFSPTSPAIYDRLEQRGSNHVLILKTLQEYEFDAAGRLSEIRDPNGNAIRFIYTGDRLTRIENDGGRWVDITYNDGGYIGGLDAPEGRHYEFGYTGARLTSYADARGKVWEFEYQEHPVGTLLDVHGVPYDATDYYLSAVKTPEGHYKNQETYNERGEVLEQWIGGREHRTFVRDEAARTITVTGAYGQITVYHYDEQWRLGRIDHPGDTYELFGYDDHFNRTDYRDRGGQEWHWTYDGRGNRETEDGPLGRHREWEYNELDKVTHFSERIDANMVRETTFDYDARGNLTEVCNALSACSTILYDGRGLPTDVYDFAGNRTHHAYDTEGDLREVTNAESETTDFDHDAAGRVIEMQTPLLFPYTYVYDPADHLLDVNGPLGYHLGYRYDDNGNLEFEVNPNGAETEYTHDSHEMLTQVKNPLGFTTVYTYGLMNELKGYQDGEGRAWAYTYNAALRLTDIDGPLSTHSHFVYDDAGNVTDVTDAEGRVTHTDYDALYHPIAVTRNYRPDLPSSADTNVTTTYEYNLVGDILRAIDAENNPTEFEYDLLGRMTLKRSAEGQVWQHQYDALGNLTRTIDPLLHETAYEYDRVYRLWKITAADQNVTAFEYDGDGNLADQIDPLSVVTHYDYDELDRLVREVRNYHPGQPEDASTNVTTEYEYDPAGNTRFVVEPRDFRAEFRYDAANRLIDKIDYEGGYTHYTYDKVDNLLTVTDDNQHTTAYVYDVLDRRIRVENPETHTIQFTYDKVGGLTKMVDANGNPTHYDLDGLGRVIKMIDALNGVWFYQYDRVGNLLVEIDANGHARAFEFDRVYRLLSVTDAEQYSTAFRWNADDELIETLDGNGHGTTYAYDPLHRLVELTNAEDETTQYRYDPLGNQTHLIAADNTVTFYGYDPLYRLNTVIENFVEDGPQNNDTNVVTRYVYDASGNLAGIVNANDAMTQFEYDGLGRLLREIDPLNNTWEYTYDGVGNRLTRRDANGALTHYGYFPDDQVQHIDYADGAFVAYTYDPNNNRTLMQDSLGATAWTYDALNRITQVVDPFGRVLGSEYDPVGNRTALIYPDQLRVTYAYYANNWLRAMLDPKDGATTYTRDGAGNITHIAYPNSTVTDATFDRVNRVLTLLNQQIGGATKTNSAFTYTYNEVGHVTQVINQYGWRQPEFVTENYTYDGLHRLAGMTNSDGVMMAYAYDKVGNRLTWNTNDDLTTQTPRDGFTARYAYNAANQLLTAQIDSKQPNSDLTVSFEYDRNGNRVNQLTSDRNGPLYGVDYAYDPDNRLSAAQDYQLVDHGKRVNRATTTLAYDGGGRRLVQTYDPRVGNGGEKRVEYVFDGLDPVAEYSLLNGQHDNYYRGAQGRIVTMHHFPAGSDGQMYWYAYNFKGDVANLTKQSGQSTHNYRYDPYGGVVPDTGNFTDPHNHYTLTGKEFDENTGLIYFGARHYDPKMGAWVTQDTFRGTPTAPQSLHRYGYVYSNPATYYDPYGYWPEFLDKAVESVSKTVSEAAEATGKWVNENKDAIVKGVAIGAAVVAATAVTVATAGAGAPAAAIILGATFAGAGAAATGTVVSNVALAREWHDDLVENTLIGGGIGAAIGSIGAVAVHGVGGTIASLKESASLVTRPFSNVGRMLTDPKIKYSLKNLLWDNRTFASVRQQYWRISGGANGSNLHHWLFQNSWKWVPQGLRNAGFNLIEIPGFLNQWAGGIAFREWLIRLGILGSSGLSLYGSAKIGESIIDWLEYLLQNGWGSSYLDPCQ